MGRINNSPMKLTVSTRQGSVTFAGTGFVQAKLDDGEFLVGVLHLTVLHGGQFDLLLLLFYGLLFRFQLFLFRLNKNLIRYVNVREMYTKLLTK